MLSASLRCRAAKAYARNNFVAIHTSKLNPKRAGKMPGASFKKNEKKIEYHDA
jgi:hypothetical protein